MASVRPIQGRMERTAKLPWTPPTATLDQPFRLHECPTLKAADTVTNPLNDDSAAHELRMPYDASMNPKPQPIFGREVYLSRSSFVCGDLVLGDFVTIMPHVVVRADIARIRVGNRVNLQDGVIVHTPMGVPLDIGDDVGVGHRAIIHCRRIDSHCLIGMGSILLDGCEIGSDCVIAAGAVLTPGTCIPAGSIVMGVPGKVVRAATEKDMQAIDHVVQSYIDLGRQHASGAFPNITPSMPNA